jgi:outer membrane protein assembly factor BamB
MAMLVADTVSGARSESRRRRWWWRLLPSLAAVCTLLCRGQEPAAEWPCYHGPYRDNRSPDSGLLKSWPEAGPALLWTAAGLGKGYSSVSLAGGLIYTAGMVDGQTFVVALDGTGKEQWRRPNGTSWQAAPSQPYAMGYAGSRGTPTVDQGRVYHLGESGSLSAFAAVSGEVVWTLDLLTTFDAKVPKYGFTESVLIDGERLLCSPAGAKAAVACLEKATGKLIWAATELTGMAAFSSLQVVDVAGVRQVIGMTSRVAFGLDAASGKKLWTVTHGNERDNSATDPIIQDGQVFVTSGYGTGSRLIRLTPTATGIGAETVWSTKLLDNHHGGMLLLDGFLYGAGHESKGWHCLDAKTGLPRWNAPGKGSLTWAEGRLYCLEERGTLALVEPTPAARRVISSFQLPGGGDGLYWAHPVVCGGRLYVRHADTLFAYAVRAP